MAGVSTALDDLSPRMRPLADRFLAKLMEARIPVMIVTTLRTPEEQAEKVAKGLSWVTVSKHQSGDAIDVAPYAIYDLHGPDKAQWDETDPIWTRIGQIGQGCGLKWGVIKGGVRVDVGHFEWIG